MGKKNNSSISIDDLAVLRAAAAEAHEQLRQKPGIDELLSPEEILEAAPFYFALREYIRQLKEARDEAKLTLVEVAKKCGLAVESLSRLETGAQTNPTWKTLGMYAKAVGRQPSISAVALVCVPPPQQDTKKLQSSSSVVTASDLVCNIPETGEPSFKYAAVKQYGSELLHAGVR